MLDITHRRIRTDGIQIHIVEAGQGPLVILLHEFPELWYSWRHQFPALAAAGYHAVAPGLRGYGESDAPEAVGRYSIAHMTADVIGVLDSDIVEHAVVVGHDWGAGSGAGGGRAPLAAPVPVRPLRRRPTPTWCRISS